MFNTGVNRWRYFTQWPPALSKTRLLYCSADEQLSDQAPEATEPAYDEFISDPNRPVPFTEDIDIGMTPAYMTDDQRFAARRPDVLVYQTDTLDEAVTICGPLVANLHVSTSQSDADWIVKLIDVFPADAEDDEYVRAGEHLSNYQMMVRSEVIRGRFRENPSKPRPFESDQPAIVRLPLQDVLHTFRPGHRIMIQVQSTWFPLVDRNPQKYVENIFQAKDGDFVRATHRLYRDAKHPSSIEFSVLED
jgi:putative CocE/NonD family hydrolase